MLFSDLCFQEKDVYTNLAELHSKAGDQAKAEKFKNLAENF